MAVRILIAGLVGGIVFFIWSAIAHMALPLGEQGVTALPNEEPVLSVMKASIDEPGLYFFPGIDMQSELTAEQQAEWERRMRAGPSGIMVVYPDGREPMSAMMLLTELASNVAAALLAAFIASRVATGFVGRWLVVGLLGPISWLSISASYWNWYGFPADYSIAAFVTETAGWLLAGLALALIVRPRASASATPWEIQTQAVTPAEE